jgi:hypothetical protein
MLLGAGQINFGTKIVRKKKCIYIEINVKKEKQLSVPSINTRYDILISNIINHILNLKFIFEWES